MKLIKFASMTIVAVLALWASNAKAREIGSPQFEKLNFALTALQQDLNSSQTSSNAFASTITAFRINNKDLLKFLATTFNTNWPVGAQLALGEVVVIGTPILARSDIFVVDKTGTNAVFDVSTGINVGDTNVVYFTFSANSIVFKGKEVIMPTGIHLARTDFGMIFFHLHVETNGIPTTDLYFEGLNKGGTNEKPGRTTGPVTVHDKSAVAGDGTLGDATWTVIKGKVTGSGKWKVLPLG